MTPMIADREFPYRGHQLKVGERFEADDEHVDVLTRIGHAHVEAGSQTYQTRVMEADTPRSRRRSTRALRTDQTRQ